MEKPTGGRPAYEVFASAQGTSKPQPKYDKFVSAGKVIEGDDPKDEAKVETSAPPSDGRPLFEVLQAAKEKKQQEWESAHNPFQPPKAMDEEEVKFLEETETAEKKLEREQQEALQDNLRSFRDARQNYVVHKPDTDALANAESAADAVGADGRDKPSYGFQHRLKAVKVIAKSKTKPSSKSSAEVPQKPAANALLDLTSYGSGAEQSDSPSD